MVVSESQLATLRTRLTERFEAEMVQHLVEHHEHLRERSVEEVHALVRAGRARGLKSGIFATDDVRRFLMFVGRFGLDFGETKAWAGPILRDRELTGTEKVAALTDAVSAEGASR